MHGQGISPLKKFSPGLAAYEVAGRVRRGVHSSRPLDLPLQGVFGRSLANRLEVLTDHQRCSGALAGGRCRLLCAPLPHVAGTFQAGLQGCISDDESPLITMNGGRKEIRVGSQSDKHENPVRV